MNVLRNMTRDRFSFLDVGYLTIGGVLIWNGHPFLAIGSGIVGGFLSGVAGALVARYTGETNG